MVQRLLRVRLGRAAPQAQHPIRPDGYGFWLLLLKPLHSFALVIFTQHLMGLAIAVLIYALLRTKFGLPNWGATLAAAPVLFDAYQIQLEHLIMSDTMFTLLVVGVITLVLWHRKMSWRLGVVVGLLLALTALTRSIGLPILALVVVYLLVKRTGWKPIIGRGDRLRAPGARPTWPGSPRRIGNFAMTNSDGLDPLHADGACSPTARRWTSTSARSWSWSLLCINDPPSTAQRLRPVVPVGPGQRDGQGPGGAAPLGRGSKFTDITNEAAGEFAKRAILSQPGDYLGIVARDFFRAFHWGRPRFPDATPTDMYEFMPYYELRHHRESKRLPNWPLLPGPDRHRRVRLRGRARRRPRSSRPWADIMQRLPAVFYLPGIVLGGIMLVGLYGVVVRWRTLGGPVLLPWLGAFGLVARARRDGRVRLPLRAAGGAAGLHRGRDHVAPRVRPTVHGGPRLPAHARLRGRHRSPGRHRLPSRAQPPPGAQPSPRAQLHDRSRSPARVRSPARARLRGRYGAPARIRLRGRSRLPAGVRLDDRPRLPARARLRDRARFLGRQARFPGHARLFDQAQLRNSIRVHHCECGMTSATSTG